MAGGSRLYSTSLILHPLVNGKKALAQKLKKRRQALFIGFIEVLELLRCVTCHHLDSQLFTQFSHWVNHNQTFH